MTLDIQTTLILLVVNVFATAIALPWLMGWRVSRAARAFQLSAMAHAVGWLAFMLAPSIQDRWVTALAFVLLGSSFVLVLWAVGDWMGARSTPLRWFSGALAALTPIGYVMAYDSYPWRVGWSNAGLSLQMALICLALVRPTTRAGVRWRTLVFASMATLAVLTLWRGVLGAFFTEAYPFYRATHPVNVVAAVAANVALALTTLGLLAAWREEAEREITHQAQTDGLTGLLNRQTFLERAVLMLAQAKRYDEALSVVMIDIDHFKQINDRHGHAGGDAALRQMSLGLRACTRASDLICRYGGEEFCVLLSHARGDDALHFDQRLRDWIGLHATPVNGLPIAYSAGVAAREAANESLEDLINRADAALYDAKSMGRGRMVQSVNADTQSELGFD